MLLAIAMAVAFYNLFKERRVISRHTVIDILFLSRQGIGRSLKERVDVGRHGDT